MKGLVFDTSIWIEYFRGNPEFFDTCQTLLENGEVFGLELIFTELLQGARGKIEIDLILAYFYMVTSLDEPFLIIESGLLSHKSDFVHYGVGLIDVVIVKAVQKNDLLLWTLDKKLRKVTGYDLLFNP